ncbi:MAG: prephenate dehydrogenase/arogenate dehydrogenase family protein [Chloroflexi bacterium]|nr:prephenate dehydrogenase/arogenate dehydrogenase family protein [Chloroflexota bacterium]
MRAAAAAALPGRISFLGFGLIAGSIALALREAGCTARVVAWTPRGTGPHEGLRRGLVDEVGVSAAAAIEGAGLVVLAGPPRSILQELRDLAGPLRAAVANGATITDVASTKGLIVATAEDLGIPFVGGHPMGGRETTGVGAASADLFVDRPWVIVAADGTDAGHRDRVEALATATGARPVRMTAIDHDLAVAAISHLPLIASAALVEAVTSDEADWGAARPLGAGGWRDMTRLARGDTVMGADIIATNARPIAGHLRAYRDAIDGWLAELDAMIAEDRPVEPDEGSVRRLRGRLESARAELEREPRP